MTSDYALQIQALTKTYREGDSVRQVLAQLDLTVAGGECIALLGNSGAGKSTLLNLISGIDRPDSGLIRVGGTVITDLSEAECTLWRRRQIGFIFQFFNLIPTLTVIENVQLPLQLNGSPRHQQRSRALELLAAVHLADRSDTFPDYLSGGEQQRLAIVRALIHQPALILADEPTGNLDEQTGQAALDLLLTMTRKQAITVLLVTHSHGIAARADRALRLHQGRFQPCSPTR